MSSYSKTVTPGDDDFTRDVVLSGALWEIRLFSLGKMIILLSLFCLILISLFLVHKGMVITGVAPLAEEEHHRVKTMWLYIRFFKGKPVNFNNGLNFFHPPSLWTQSKASGSSFCQR